MNKLVVTIGVLLFYCEKGILSLKVTYLLVCIFVQNFIKIRPTRFGANKPAHTYNVLILHNYYLYFAMICLT